MKSLTKKIVALAFIILTAFALVGCGARVECYYYSDSLGTEYHYRVVVPPTLQNTVESTAKVKGDGTKYTIASYLSELAFVRGLTYEGKFTQDGNSVYSIYLFIENADEEDSAVNAQQPTFEWGFFTNKYTYKTASPFNGLYDEYNGTPTPGGLIDVLKNGYDYQVATKEDLPGLVEVFPALASVDLTQFGLDFYWVNSKIEAINGTTSISGRTKYSYWEGKFDGQDRYFEYNYVVANPLGWYVVILGIGVIAIIVLFLLSKKNKKQPQMKPISRVRTPYDPSPRIIIDKTPNGQKPDIFGLGGEDFTVEYSETAEQKARRELEDIFMGRTVIADDKEENNEDKDEKND